MISHHVDDRGSRRTGVDAERDDGSIGVDLDERVAADVLFGTANVAARALRIVTAPLIFIAGRGVDPTHGWWPGPTPEPVVSAIRERGERVCGELERVATRVFREIVRTAIEAVLKAVDLTDVVRRHVDLDALVRDVDLDAVVDRVDVDAVAARLDVDAVVSRVDVDGIVAKVDVDAVASRIDVGAVASRIDVDSVASRLDLGRVIARIDLDGVAKRLDVDAVVARVDLDAVLGRLDLPAIAMKVVTAIDLPEIVRESTGPAASEVVRGIRAEGAQADDVVARMVDRLLHRRKPGPQETG